jgi:DNA-directed RNA polymerase II subunit RPB7
MSQDANADDSNVDYTGAPAQFDFMARIKRLNALVPFLFFVVLTVSLFLAKLVNTLLKPICSAMFGSKGPEKVDEVPPFDQLIMPGQVGYEDPVPEGALNNKLSGLRSYRIEDNPKYAKLFPEVIGGDHGKTPTKAPKTQNMAYYYLFIPLQILTFNVSFRYSRLTVVVASFARCNSTLSTLLNLSL